MFGGSDDEDDDDSREESLFGAPRRLVDDHGEDNPFADANDGGEMPQVIGQARARAPLASSDSRGCFLARGDPCRLFGWA